MIRGICLRWDLLSLTCICLCAVLGAPGLHINSPACPQDCIRFNHQHWSGGMFRGRGGIVQQHQITNNFPICIFLRMVRHFCLMHLPVHPKGVAKLMEACDSPKDVAVIGTLCQYNIDDSDNRKGSKTNSLWIIFSCYCLVVISLRARNKNKTLKVSIASAWSAFMHIRLKISHTKQFAKKGCKRGEIKLTVYLVW